MENTLLAWREALKVCKTVFLKKTLDYGTSWRVLRPASLTDQIFIKASRIRTIMENGAHVNEGIVPEFIGIVNYCIMALIQLSAETDLPEDLSAEEAEKRYDAIAQQAEELMLAKNHDYGEAWKLMRVPTFADMLLMRVKRIRQIEEADGKTLVSEGVESNYLDMINYSLFALIHLNAGVEGKDVD